MLDALGIDKGDQGLTLVFQAKCQAGLGEFIFQAVAEIAHQFAQVAILFAVAERAYIGER